MKKLFSILVIALLFFGLLYGIGNLGLPGGGFLLRPTSPLPQADGTPAQTAPDLQAALDQAASGAQVSAIITLRSQADLSQITTTDRATRQRAVIGALQKTANQSQQNLRIYLNNQKASGQVKEATFFWIFNGVEVTASPQVIQTLQTFPEVKRLDLNHTAQAPSLQSLEIQPAEPSPVMAAAPEPNIALVNAPAMWNLGFTGQGVVVASMDTGVEVTHPDLNAQWRGGSNSWFDPYGEHPTTPTDTNGHGTMTMSVIVGRDAGGTSIGMAPNAQWIAVKIFNDAGTRTDAAVHQGYQWLLDPDGNPNTPDAPQVINNSWLFDVDGCYLTFEPDLETLRTAGILPVFSGGNFGPGPDTGRSPANNPSGFGVGVVSNQDVILGFGSQGPTTCGGGASRIYPSMVGPGLDTRVAYYLGGYTTITGTSVSAPHVSGALALLFSAFGSLSLADQEASLLNSAVDLGPAGPDNTYGYGRVDVYAAYQWLLANRGQPTLTPPPPPQATSTFTPTSPPPVTATLTPTQVPPPPVETATMTSTPLPVATQTQTATQPGLPPGSTATFTPTVTVGPGTPKPATATPSQPTLVPGTPSPSQKVKVYLPVVMTK